MDDGNSAFLLRVPFFFWVKETQVPTINYSKYRYIGKLYLK